MLQEFDAIEFPGLVENPKKAIAALGGMTTLSHILSKKKPRMELHFNPDNVYDKPVCGERRKMASFLIKVIVRRKKNSQEPPTYRIQCLGYVKNAYQFENLVDFQFLPIYKDPSTGQPVDALDPDTGIIPRSPLDTKCLDNLNAPIIIVPKIFSRIDSAELVPSFYRDEPHNDGLLTNLGQFSKTVIDSTNIVVFDLVKPLPVNADTEINKKLKIKYITSEQFTKIKSLFDECPIWTRIALQHESGISADKLKVIVPAFAFYYSTGPWRTLFVRLGYDPRKDYNSRKYQIFDYRLRTSTGIAQYISVRRERIRNEDVEDDEYSQDVNYPYITTNKLPRSRQCMLRYCDLHLPKVQELLANLPPPAPSVECNEKTGWLPAGFEQEVRFLVQESVKNLLKSQLKNSKETALESDIDMENDEDDDENFDESSNIFDDTSSEITKKNDSGDLKNDSDDNSNLDEFIEEFMERP